MHDCNIVFCRRVQRDWRQSVWEVYYNTKADSVVRVLPNHNISVNLCDENDVYICISANLCEVIDVYISSTATMNSPIAVNAKKCAYIECGRNWFDSEVLGHDLEFYQTEI